MPRSHAVQPVGLGVQRGAGVGAHVLEQDQVDGAVLRRPAADDPAVDPDGRARRCPPCRTPAPGAARGTSRARTSPSSSGRGRAAGRPRARRAPTGSMSSGSTHPVAVARATTSTAPTSRSACRTAVSVEPSHHFRSSVVPGPNRRSHRSTSCARATSSGSARDRLPRASRRPAPRWAASWSTSRGCPARTIVPAACRHVITRDTTGNDPAHDFPCPYAIEPSSSGSRSRSCAAVSGPSARPATAAAVTSSNHRSASSTNPASRTSFSSRRRSTPATLVLDAACTTGSRSRVDREQGPPHREVLDQRAVVVERAVQVRHREAVDARPRRQVQPGRVGGVQADHGVGGGLDAAHPERRGHGVPTSEPRAALGDVEVDHAGDRLSRPCGCRASRCGCRRRPAQEHRHHRVPDRPRRGGSS